MPDEHAEPGGTEPGEGEPGGSGGDAQPTARDNVPYVEHFTLRAKPVEHFTLGALAEAIPE